MEYIKEILDVDVERSEWTAADKLPYFLSNEYRFESVRLGDNQCLFLKPIGELATINAIRKHLKRLRETCACPAVFELPTITRQRRASFIKAKMAFVVPGKQLYLPFMGVQLQDRCDNEAAVTTAMEKLLPSAQMLLFAFILRKNKEMYLNKMANQFKFSAMTISRASDQLARMRLVSKVNDGVRKVLTSNLTPEELYQKATPHLIDPVRKVVYINKSELGPRMFRTGTSALADNGMLSPPSTETWGSAESPKELSQVAARLVDTDMQCALELWKYDPLLISGDGQMDVLSLAASLHNAKDERVELALQEVLQKEWGKNGTWN